ncbi:DEAD-box ATP-dependent RNA helicase 31-like [Pistacia vera]|uniref:DEAD-box ATP-dependent RNA helicase 31-like n=1 Tax=Pistacia vera TaxID=55513 RepID=UPI0012638334|nr:DEAD-box ATP-dependent RNA helicase 31-like [Pistacia vera]
MPIKLLPHLRFLNPSLPITRFPLMNLKPSIHTSEAITSLRQAFPFKLKYQGFATHGNDQHLQHGVRKLSTRPFRPRTGSISRSEFSRDHEGGRGEIRASKSLIEDEAELSDWVSELGPDSSRGKHINRDKEESDFRKPRGGDRDSFLMKRRRESNSDGLYESNRRVNRNSANSFSRNNNSRFNSNFENGNGEPYSRKKNSGFERGSVNSFTEKRSERKDRGSFKKEGKIFKRERRFSDDDIGDDVNEERGRIMSGIGDLLNEKASDVDDVSDVDDDDDDSTFRKNARTSIGLDDEGGETKSSPGKYDSYLSESRFDQCSLSPLSLKGIKDAGYEKMTVVQEASLPVILKGKDVLAKAKTGTGKTVAFLLPSIEVVTKSPPVGRDQKRPPILVLVVCPTRELATQAAAEANTLLKYHPSIGVQVVIGGTRLAMEQKRMQATPCQILVATPGRLRDHIENTAGFATRLMGVKVLVLDEADQLLDMGFRKDIENIIAAVPKERQTLLFSATVPEEVRQICHVALKRDHEFINTVQEGSEETHSQVKQMHLVAPLDKHFPLLYVLLKEHVADNVDYKVLVFCTTAMVTRLVANLLGELKLNVREIHSRKPQSYRTRVSDEFRKSKGLILVTSDVSARGVDYPDVTLVIQVGLPADREQYIHRLGRTGRKGKEGQGVLLLAPWEEFFLSTVKDLPITKASVPSFDPDTQKKVDRALSHVEMKHKESAYQAWLGYYNSIKKVGRDKCRLVELANEYSRCMGLDNPPAIPNRVLAKMGLRNIPGLRSQ